MTGRSLPTRWNALHPYDEHSPLIVPREDLRALEAQRDRYREALELIAADGGNCSSVARAALQGGESS